MITEQAAETWDRDLDHLFTTIGHHFSSLEPRRRMRDYVRGLFAPVARKNSWQLAEHVGHATPDGLQHLLSRAHWTPTISATTCRPTSPNTSAVPTGY